MNNKITYTGNDKISLKLCKHINLQNIHKNDIIILDFPKLGEY